MERVQSTRSGDPTLPPKSGTTPLSASQRFKAIELRLRWSPARSQPEEGEGGGEGGEMGGR